MSGTLAKSANSFLIMSILKYFKRKDNASSNALLDHEGPPSTTVPSEVIVTSTANDKVRDVLDKSFHRKRLQ